MERGGAESGGWGGGNFYSHKYRITHKGWDCKDDLKLFKYNDIKFKLKGFPWV